MISRFHDMIASRRATSAKDLRLEVLSLSRDDRMAAVLEFIRREREGWVKYATDPKALAGGTQGHFAGGVAAMDGLAAKLQTIVDELHPTRGIEEPPVDPA